MKMFNRILIFSVALAITLVSCDNITDIQQPGNLPADQALQTVEDLDLNLTGLYANLDIHDQMYTSTIRTDEVTVGPGNGGQGLGGQYQWVMNASSDIAATAWNSGYSSINELNRFLRAAEDIQPESNQQALYNDVVGQAYAMRAFEYFKLLSFFSVDITDNSSMGVPTFTDVPGIDAEPTRNTTGETFQRILDDISQAQNLIDPSASNTTRFTQDALTAMLARIAAYRQNYQRAQDFSQQLIDNHTLATPTQYQELFVNDTNGGDEVIFKLERTVNDPYDNQAAVGTPAGAGWIGNIWAQVTVTQGAHYQAEQALVDAYPQDDVRFGISIHQGQDSDGNAVNFVRKFAGNVPGENVSLMNDQKVFRLSEMYLINAEAKAHPSTSGTLAGAATVMQELRNARLTSGTATLPVYANEQEAFADILRERRIELAFEGHRYFDLRRMGPTAQPADIGFIDRDETVTGIYGCANYSACDGPDPAGPESYKYTVPIPLSELNANPEISQSPAYE